MLGILVLVAIVAFIVYCSRLPPQPPKTNTGGGSLLMVPLAGSEMAAQAGLSRQHEERLGLLPPAMIDAIDQVLKNDVAAKLAEETPAADLIRPTRRVYVLVNPSMPGLVKIGWTTGTSEDRARQLSAVTGVATGFMVAYEELTPRAAEAERAIHDELRSHRYSRNREFFQIPLKDAIAVVGRVCAGMASEYGRETGHQCAVVPISHDAAELWDEDNELADEDAPYAEALAAAEDAFYGEDEDSVDEASALQLYQRAADLGSVLAWRQMARILMYNPELQSEEKALACLKEGAKRGDGQCYAEMGCLFAILGDTESAMDCWDKYFSSFHFQGRRNGVGACTYKYFDQVQRFSLPFLHRDKIVAARDAVRLCLQQRIGSEIASPSSIETWKRQLTEIESL